MFARVAAICPDAAVPHENLAESLRLLKRFDEAHLHAKRAIGLNSTRPEAWNILGLIAFDQKVFSKAEDLFREALRLRPEYADALVNLGSTLQAAGKFTDAARHFRKALILQPDHVAALTNLAQVLTSIGDPELWNEAEALYCRAVALAPRLLQALNGMGNVLRLQGRLHEATPWYERALRIDPAWPKTWLNMGHLLRELGQYSEAVDAFHRARELDGDLARYHTNLGTLWADQENFQRAADHFRLALAQDNKLGDAHHGLGMALLEQGRLDDAETCLRTALSSAVPKPEVTHVAIARLQAERGDFEASNRTARDALAMQPSLAGAFCQLALNLKGRLPKPDIERMERLCSQNYLTTEVRSLLHFALAAIRDAQGFYAEAAHLMETANALQISWRAARGRLYDPNEHSLFVERLICVFSSEFLARIRGWGNPDPRPTFIVGLPRSGTTLVEQIIASHPSAHGAGELPDLQQLFQAMPELIGRTAADPFDSLRFLDQAAAMRASRRYLDRLDTLAPDASRVVDKMPDNITMLGLIASILPAAKVILCTRDLRDIAVSCWQAGFATLRWANDFEHIARRFADHERLLAYWRQVRPASILEVRYEDLVRDVENHSRRLIDFLELQWDPACLNFHSTRRVVRTASMAQVRQPAHTRSVDRWRNYAELLQPLFQSLAQHGAVPGGTES
jgi:tetratricopeptide (TPR) repeat protein